MVEAPRSLELAGKLLVDTLKLVSVGVKKKSKYYK